MWRKRRTTLPPNEGKLNTRRTDEDVDGKNGRQLSFISARERINIDELKRCSLSTSERIACSKIPL